MMTSKTPAFLAALMLLALAPFAVQAQVPVRSVVDFNPQWKFVQGETTGAERAA